MFARSTSSRQGSPPWTRASVRPPSATCDARRSGGSSSARSPTTCARPCSCCVGTWTRSRVASATPTRTCAGPRPPASFSTGSSAICSRSARRVPRRQARQGQSRPRGSLSADGPRLRRARRGEGRRDHGGRSRRHDARRRAVPESRGLEPPRQCSSTRAGRGDVELRWARNDGSIAFSVWNSGDPIPAEDLPHLFEPMFRSDRSRNRETGGAGLGLAIARHLIEAHGGTLVAENPPAGGARFAATIPAA